MQAGLLPVVLPIVEGCFYVDPDDVCVGYACRLAIR